MPHARYTNEEIARLGETLYEQQIRAKVEAGNRGKYIVIDIETGDYEVGEDSLVLAERLQARHPEAALYALRIGYAATARIGARLTTAVRS
jgi:hypothetical protein